MNLTEWIEEQKKLAEPVVCDIHGTKSAIGCDGCQYAGCYRRWGVPLLKSIEMLEVAVEALKNQEDHEYGAYADTYTLRKLDNMVPK